MASESSLIDFAVSDITCEFTDRARRTPEAETETEAELRRQPVGQPAGNVTDA